MSVLSPGGSLGPPLRLRGLLRAPARDEAHSAAATALSENPAPPGAHLGGNPVQGDPPVTQRVLAQLLRALSLGAVAGRDPRFEIGFLHLTPPSCRLPVLGHGYADCHKEATPSGGMHAAVA